MLTATRDLMLPATVTRSRSASTAIASCIAQGRNIVLKELGLGERYVAAADPSLQPDVRPDHEPITHLPSPWRA